MTDTEHLSQDLNAGLGRWLSSRLDAREVVRTHHVYTPSPDAYMTEWELNNDQPSREG
jgi:hypothetical protein